MCTCALQAGNTPIGAEGSQFVAERAELLLRQGSKHGLRTRSEALQWLGSHFRIALDVPSYKSDYQVPLLPL